MASSDGGLNDPLLCFRHAIATNQDPLLTSSADPSSASDAEPDLAKASHIHFNPPSGRITFSLDDITRFYCQSAQQLINVRTLYFAWKHQDLSVPNYMKAQEQLNAGLSAPGGAGGALQDLKFADRTELTSWLDGSAEESENIRPVDAEKAAAHAAGSAAVASGSAGGIAPVTIAGGGLTAARGSKMIDPRLAEIYQGERKMADRNSILRGIKPTDFSHIRKQADVFLGRNRHSKSTIPTPMSTNPALVSNLKKPTARRLEPIILLSPSASSLLRMSNIIQFLERGIFAPADSAAAGSSNTASILHTQRMMSTIDSRPLRFVLVDNSDQFKPDYWSRVVAVFTTGQVWQFKSYKWQTAPELFAHALGIYIGWTGEGIPDAVKGWGRSVKVAAVDKWTHVHGDKGRWRDREVVEGIWTAIEESMRAKGWGKEGFPG